MHPTPEQIDAIKAEHSDVHAVTLELRGEEHTVVVRSPTRQEYGLFLKESLNEAMRHASLKKLVRPCVLFPTGPELDALAERFVAIHETLSGPILELAGVTKAELGKKL